MAPQIEDLVRSLLVGEARTCSVSVVTPKGGPGLATLWFLAADGGLWFHSRAGALVAGAQGGKRMVFACDEWNPPERMCRVKLAGPTRIDAEPERVATLYERYLGDPTVWNDGWHDQVRDGRFALIQLLPDSGAAVAFSDLHGDGDMSATLGLSEILNLIG